MELFKYGLFFNTTGEIYYGLKKEFITTQHALEFIFNGRVICISENDKRLLSLNKNEFTSFNFLCENLRIINNNFKNLDIIKEEVETNVDDNIPNNYKIIWELESLLKAEDTSDNIDECLEKVYEYYYLLDFPKSWNKFLLFSQYDSISTNIDKYKNFKNHIYWEVEKVRSFN